MRPVLLMLCLVGCGSALPSVEDAGTGGGVSGSGGGVSGTGGGVSGSGGGVSGSGGGSALFPPPSPEGCVQDVTAGVRDYSCDGLRYRATIPASCLTAACGLILDVHGLTMSAEMQEANTKLAARAPAKGFIVVQPSANPAPPSASWNPGTDDDKVFATAQLFARVFHTDPKRLHFTGFSQGGMMTWRMLCKHADAWASVAPAAGGDCYFNATSGRPTREVPTLFLFGTSDALVSYSGVAVPQRNAVVSGWAMSGPVTLAADAGYTRVRYTSDAGTPFEMLTHQYSGAVVLGGHCYPGSTDPGTATGQLFTFKCNGTNGFDWGNEVLDWFDRHRKP
jgi:hypothetical protein